MKAYLETLAELFKLAAMYQDKFATAYLAELLERSTDPAAALEYWQGCKRYISCISDNLLLQQVEDYLTERVKQ